MTPNSTTTDLERRVARAIAQFIQPLPYDELPPHRKAVTPRAEWGQADIDEVVEAALKAHAEWLDGNELEIRAKPPFNFTVNLLEETKPAAQQEDQSHD